MIITSWNVQGLGQALKQHGVGRLLRKYGTCICGILESKCARVDVNKLVDRMAPGWKFVSNFHLDHRGRIMVIWDVSRVNMAVLDMSPQHVACMVTCLITKRRVAVCFTYGLHSVGARRPVWNHITRLVGENQVPWMIVGDFNCV